MKNEPVSFYSEGAKLKGILRSRRAGGAGPTELAAVDVGVTCAGSTCSVGTGREWVRSTRREYDWLEVLRRIEEDRKGRGRVGRGDGVKDGAGAMIAGPAGKE